ncbi:MFS general substrate transporter [Pluteus cervinus]|uniref:MFS general substrate transporter n=1 Tax=Pluteus cervinus TaxID=181527 RepID=A0ACD3ABS8_9AGAR|nr:MFS general substrate transporter [Pluteus cervinus]
MWIQAVAIILPRVQRHYSVPDSYIGTLSSSMFAGMMVGAVGWGTCSDLMGRSTAFNATLFFTALFGLLASFANSFFSLCIVLFFLGSAVGGSMPTDGTLLLEHMPKGKQYMVTALSVFFSIGAVLAAVVGLLVVPQHSCLASEACDAETQNQGWKYLLFTLGLITLGMFLARIVFFRLYESPRYLVHAGRPQEALESLQMISRFNGSDLALDLDDVRDHRLSKDFSKLPTPSPPSDDEATARPSLRQYDATGESNTPLDGHVFSTPQLEQQSRISSPLRASLDATPRPSNATQIPPSVRHSRRLSRDSRRPTSIYGKRRSVFMERWVLSPLRAWWDRVQVVLTPEWMRTTLLVWATWWAMSLAYTMFNVFLPKLLETRPTGTVIAVVPKGLEESLWEVVIFTIGGCPGAILGAYMVESPLGRRWSLAGSTFITAVFCAIFISVRSAWAVQLSTVGISLSATTMWAVLYGWTPEIFATKVRGTACGIASALSRVGGMIAPIVGGMLLMLDRSFPVYVSIVVFTIASICVLLLNEGEGDSGRGKGERAIVH